MNFRRSPPNNKRYEENFNVFTPRDPLPSDPTEERQDTQEYLEKCKFPKFLKCPMPIILVKEKYGNVPVLDFQKEHFEEPHFGK